VKYRYAQLLDALAEPEQARLAPIYLLCGDEPFQLGSAADAVRCCARAQGYTERKVLFAGRDFDWQQLATEQDSLSLFAEKKLIDLRLPTGKPGDAGGRALRAFAERPVEDTLLLITAGKLDRNQLRTRWVTALEEAGVLVQIWPVKHGELPGWLRRHMQARGLQPDAEAVALLAERVEGNLLAADQAVEKLLLLNGPGPVDAAAVRASVADSARFDVFDMVDTALAGEASRALRMVFGLLEEGVEAVVISWALGRAVREILDMAMAVARGQPVEAVMAGARVWDSRRTAVRAALTRHRAGYWGGLLQRADRLEFMVKGMAAGNKRDELVQLVCAMAGQRPLPASFTAPG